MDIFGIFKTYFKKKDLEEEYYEARDAYIKSVTELLNHLDPKSKELITEVQLRLKVMQHLKNRLENLK